MSSKQLKPSKLTTALGGRCQFKNDSLQHGFKQYLSGDLNLQDDPGIGHKSPLEMQKDGEPWGHIAERNILALWGKLKEAYITIGKYLAEMEKVKRIGKCMPCDLTDDLSFVRFATCGNVITFKKLFFVFLLILQDALCMVSWNVYFFGGVYGG